MAERRSYTPVVGSSILSPSTNFWVDGLMATMLVSKTMRWEFKSLSARHHFVGHIV
jgi:hypothetical protein